MYFVDKHGRESVPLPFHDDNFPFLRGIVPTLTAKERQKKEQVYLQSIHQTTLYITHTRIFNVPKFARGSLYYYYIRLCDSNLGPIYAYTIPSQKYNRITLH